MLEHKGKISGPSFVPSGDASEIHPLSDPAYDFKILCEGDSWFSAGEVSSKVPNLLKALRFSKPTLLFNLASPGDTLSNISDTLHNKELTAYLCGNYESNRYNAILLSVGGNDLINHAKDIFCTATPGSGSNRQDYINPVKLDAFLNTITKGLLEISAKRAKSRYNKATPIITHVYDYAIPRNSPVKLWKAKLGGPWLIKALNDNKVPEVHHVSLCQFLIEALARHLVRIESKGLIPGFWVVSQTLGVLTPAKLNTEGESGDWINEIHPSDKGYEKLGKVMSAELAKILG